MVQTLARPAAFEYKHIVRRLVDEAWNKGQFEGIAELVAANHLFHGGQNPLTLPRGPEGVRQLVGIYRHAFPDSHRSIQDQLVDGDKVITRWTISGTHKGDFFGMPASGKRVSLTGITIDRIANGKIIETWSDADLLGLMQQIGAVPALQPFRI